MATMASNLDSVSNLSEEEMTIYDDDDDDEGKLIPPPRSWFDGSHPAITGLATTDNELLQQQQQEHNNRNVFGSINATTNTETSTAPTTFESHCFGDDTNHHDIMVSGNVIHLNDSHYMTDTVIASPHPSPSWKEISSQVLPAAARELLSSSIRRIYYTARLSYARGRWHRKYSDLGNNAGGFVLPPTLDLPTQTSLPPFSSLPWVDRQLVQEWRTYLPDQIGQQKEKGENKETGGLGAESIGGDDEENEDADFDRARVLVPKPMPRPQWQKSDVCYTCHKTFGPTRLRHHCRLCGQSFCQIHSSCTHKLPHLGYDPDVPERVCLQCKQLLLEQNLAERVAWRLARCRDYIIGNLTPYFETGLDTVEAAAMRITKAALAMAKSIPLGAQATIAVETVDVLRKYGLTGIYGIILRKEFLAAADLLQKALGINKTSWPLSVHELSAAIFYALAQHRALRGLNPEHEHIIHSFKPNNNNNNNNEGDVMEDGGLSPFVVGDDNFSQNKTTLTSQPYNAVLDKTDTYNLELENVEPMIANLHTPLKQQEERNDGEPKRETYQNMGKELPFTPVCDPVHDSVIASLVFYAPIALNFIYATKEVDMQLLAAQQGWRLLFAYLGQEVDGNGKLTDRPASALFVHSELKIACLAVRGTATINDVITDIRQIPVPFPDVDPNNSRDERDGEWTTIFTGQGIALCGMASAAVNIFREYIDSLLVLAKQGYRIRVCGHSLGGGVATMIGALILRHLKRESGLNNNDIDQSSPVNNCNVSDSDLLRVYAYGTPSCVDAKLADSAKSFVTTAVLHDDVFPRLTAASCRGLLKHLLHIRETWVKTHLTNDIMALKERARTAWAPRFRHGFAMKPSSRINRYCKQQIQSGKEKLLSVKEKLTGGSSSSIGGDDATNVNNLGNADTSLAESFVGDSESSDHWGEQFFVPSPDKKKVDWAEGAKIDNNYTTSVARIQQRVDNRDEEEDDGDDDDTDGNAGTKNNTVENEVQPEPQLLLEFLGGVDTRSLGIVLDGDEFFDPEENLVESEDESVATEFFSDPQSENPGDESSSFVASDSWSLDIPGAAVTRQTGGTNIISTMKKNDNNDDDDDGSDEPAPVVLEETPLPRMFVPGKIIHLYSHRGVYKAAYVPRAFRELRRISLAGNMLSDHTTKAYYEALLEIQTARAADEDPPVWTAFDEDDTCCCCASRFTWASTSDSEAQEARDKHNCRSCGGLVCHPCSNNKVPIPSIGLTVPARVCDRCYNDMGGISATSSSMTSSFLAVDEDEQTTTYDGSTASNNNRIPRVSSGLSFDDGGGGGSRTSRAEDRPERQREKRSIVVDELASRIRSSALTCS